MPAPVSRAPHEQTARIAQTRQHMAGMATA